MALEGDPADDPTAHLTACQECSREVDALRRVAGIARSTVGLRELPPAPDRVWNRIADEAFAPPEPSPGRRATAASRRRPAATAWGRWRIAVAAAIAAVCAMTLTLVFTRGPQPPRVVATAVLAVNNPAAAGGTGRAELLESRQLRITLQGLPAATGYYEVWLYDGHQRMIGLGDAGSGRQTVVVTIPAAADIGEFPIVDISAQRLGQQEHGQSMLQGRFGR
ncbi:anti-sigma factor [Hamadaea tsunoensis]|uniref:anti-sigma factor n=1 Tax=Hamadaea tsunoensis TaxID=53368 RepID=UPI0004187219|nr:anti-sigma factor [Hamadaea tsunoensis]